MSTLIDRFDEAATLDALLRQRLSLASEELATAFAAKGRKRELAAGETLIEQDTWDDDLHFILAGSFDVFINGQHKQTRDAGEAVGELSALNAARPRTATLKASCPSLVLTVSKKDVDEIAGHDPRFWKATADIVAEQLDHRNEELGTANEHPKVFVISSSAALPIAKLVRTNLDEDDGIAVYLWNRGTFGVSDYPMSSLIDAIERADFTISIVRADDVLISRDAQHQVARDNVLLEFGISVGRLGLDRSITLVDAGANVKLPSDLTGLTTLRYQSKDDDRLERSVGKACDEARKHMEFVGVRTNRQKGY